MTFLRESYIVFRRQMRMNLRNPAWVIIGMLQPVLYLFLFGPLLKPLADQFGADNAYTFFVPGLLVQLGIFGAFFAGFSLIAEWRDGVIEAERVTPASRTALLVGRLMRDVSQLFVQALILVGLGYVLGMRASWRGVVLGISLTLLLGAACAAASNALALSTKSEDVMAPVINMVMMPVLLLSRDPAADDARSGLADPRQRLHADPVGRRRGPRVVRRDVRVERDALGDRVDAGAVHGRPVVGYVDVPQGERVALGRGRATGAPTHTPECFS